MKTKSQCSCVRFERTRLRSLFASNQVCGERANIIVLPSDFYAIVGCRDTCTPPHTEGHCAARARANTLSHQPTSPPGHLGALLHANLACCHSGNTPTALPSRGRTRHWALDCRPLFTFLYAATCA
jgi:hypothetical protein